MAYKTLKTERFLEKNELGETYDLRTIIQVDSESGEFRIQVPDELLISFTKSKNGVTKARGTMKHNYSYGRTKSEVVKAMSDCIKDHMACEISNDLVIVYKFRNNTSFYKLANGTIVPNGGYDRDYHDADLKTGAWISSEDQSNSFHQEGGMGFNINVQVLSRTIYTRPSGKSAKYKSFCYRPKEDDNDMYSSKLFNSEIADKLDGFIMKGDILGSMNQFHKTDMDNSTHEYKVVPYSDETAEFFCNMLLGVCKLADKFTSFFSNEPEVILNYIQNGGVPLLESKQ